MIAHRRAPAPRASPELTLRRLMFGDLAVFLSQLVDPAGRLLEVAGHHETWASLITESRRLVLLAPRDHSKTTLCLVYVLWQFWRHGRSPATTQLFEGPRGATSVLLMSATRAQAAVHIARLRELLLANRWLFEDILPIGGTMSRGAWSASHLRLANGAEVHARAYGSQVRGLHPDLLVLDDVISESNARTAALRERGWRYLIGALLPMHARQVLLLGTPLHREDLLHRLAPGRIGAGFGFTWRRYTALDPAGDTSLWPGRHSVAELWQLREADPATFSREYQCDPRDDAASMFPHALTQPALDTGAELTFVSRYRHAPHSEVVVLGLDPAVSAAAGADYTVAIVVAFDIVTKARRVISIRRVRGLDHAGQLALVRDLVEALDVEVGIVEANGFQRWLVEELRQFPETAGKLFPHNTGLERSSMVNGIPVLALRLKGGLWTVPCGDPESRSIALAWQEELAAFGWRDGRLESVGEHDDLVLASWFVERAIALVEEVLGRLPQEQIVTGEDLGIGRVVISSDY